MPAAPACPAPHDWQRLLLGEVSDPEAEEMERHLATCARCGQSLHGLRADDTLVEALRAGGHSLDRPRSELVAQLIERLKQARLVADSGGTDGMDAPTLLPAAGRQQELYDFLRPPEGPGELGRLGSYRVLKVLGAGGMGVVFLAEDPQLKRQVALKAMRPSLAASPTIRARFLREAQATAAVEHDHIIPIHQVGEERGVPFLAMPLLKGETLDDRLKREGKLPLADVLRIGRETAEGLAAAHARGLIHRDVKPGNLWLEGKRQRVKILDFGLARATGDESHLTQAGVIVGTPAYMGPEQAQAGAVDGRSDLFSLGVVLYRMATGVLPFKGTDAMSTLLSLALDTPRPPRELNAEVPPPLNRLILTLLAKDPADRPKSAEVVARVLEAIERPPAPAASSAPPVAAAVPAARPAPEPSPTVTLALPVAVPVAEPARAALWRRLPAGWLRPTRRRLILAGAAAALVLLTVIIIRLPGGEGTVTIETVDPAIQVSVRQGGKEVAILDPKTKQEVTLNAGAYEVEFKKGGGGLKLVAREFVLKRGDQVVVKVTWDAAAKVITNSIGMKLVLIPPGKFRMGSPQTEEGRYDNEYRHEVEITKAFYLGQYPVTKEEFAAFVKETGHPNPGAGQTDQHPVVQVDWKDAVAFCDWLTKKEGKAYRLPTEAEWEYACRAGTATAFSFGDDPSKLKTHGWYKENAGGAAHKVGEKQPNPWGLYDMHGNVWEWCQDWYDKDYYSHGPRQDPQGPSAGASHVFRGGSFICFPRNCRAAFRYNYTPSFRNGDVGFRVVRVR